MRSTATPPSTPASRARSTCSTRTAAAAGRAASWAACSGRGEERLDIKKAGIFPLMHGVRALALEKRLEETNTVQRIRRLTDLGLFDRARGQELADAFAYLLGLRLSARLERLRLHQTPDNLVDTAQISKLERDLLKDSLQIVKRFKEVVRHHFRLGMF
jgi:CBS domain-containing protein